MALIAIGSGLWRRTIGGAALGAVFTLGCNNPGAAEGGNVSVGSSLSPSRDGAISSPQSPEVVAQIGYDSFLPDGAGGMAIGGGSAGGVAGGSGGTNYPPDNAVSLRCGDRVVGLDEECDDGDDGSDACTAQCQTRDQPVLPPEGTERRKHTLGIGRHPVSGGGDGFVVAFTDLSSDTPLVSASLYNRFGQRETTGVVSSGSQPVQDANPVVAALPGGAYALAWNDFEGDGADLGIALRLLDAQHEVGGLRFANRGREFTQRDADLIWDGTQLVAAWVDYSDALNGPDLRYRTFDADLNPTSGDLTLAATGLPEAAVTLAASGGAWAAAYRGGTSDGGENVVVKAADRTFRVDAVHGGPIDDRPALVALDSTHWLVAFAVGTDPSGTGVYNVSRVRYAIVDTAPGAVTELVSKPLDPLDDVYSYDLRISQSSPALTTGNGGVYLSWRSEARPGDAGGDQLWLKLLRRGSIGPGEPVVLDTGDREILIPRTFEGSVGDQRRAALATVPLPSRNAVAVAWDDYGHTQGALAGSPDVVVHYAPLPESDTSSPERVLETWTMPSGNAWPARWTVSTSGANASYGVLNNEGKFSQGTGTDGAGWAYVNDHRALNIDIRTRVYMFATQLNAGVFVRSNDAGTRWLGARVAVKSGDRWRIFSMIDGVQTDLAWVLMPPNFYHTGFSYEYWLRFRAITAQDGSVFLGMKYWRSGAPEPTAWLLETTQPAGSAVATTFGSAGRFGLVANLNTTNRHVMYDDFEAAFFEGNQLGDPTLAQRDPAPLRRGAALYRKCQPGSTCGLGEGFCFTDADCNANLLCAGGQGEFQGVGSQARTCVPPHCANLTRDADEVRADCGGADCAPCACTSTAALFSTEYCTDSCSCGIGEGHCEYNECLPGLVCGVDNAGLFGGGSVQEACAPPHCFDRILDGDETLIDCGSADCGTNCACDQTNGSTAHCRVYCPCALGHGNCNFDEECQPGLQCGTSSGPKYGLPTGSYACTPPSCFNGILDRALGETSTDCGGACGCGGCPTGCSTTSVTPIGTTIPIPTATPYSQDFSTIGTTATATLPGGWRVDKQASPRVVGSFAAATTSTLMQSGAGMSSNSANSIYNFGSGVAATGAGYWVNSADRAIGWLATGATVGSGGTKSGNLYVQLQAPAAQDLKGLTVSYNIEKYRSGTTAPGWRIQLNYSVDGANWASAGTAFTTAFANSADANGFDPAPGATTSVTGTLNTYVARDTPLYLAWNYTTSSANSVDATSAAALAVDDVTILGLVSQ